ncbi:MAG: hypothetical protein JXX14_04900, partial [Deltaproteobacteria bacterium]|nr:hypothetical protein [Deltaproteobacteria bacterium]
RPDSYLVSVASPRYGARDSIALQNDGAMMPQLGAQTTDRLLYDYYSGRGFGLVGYGRGGGGLGGRHSSAPSISSAASVIEDESSNLLDVGESAVREMAAATVDAEISVYSVLRPVTVRAGSSAMVPVLNRKVEGQLFSRVIPGKHDVNTCVRLQNETGVVLQSGLMSVFAAGRYRGQGELSRTEPNSTTILCYGKDEDVSFELSNKIASEETRRLEWRQRELYAHRLVKREHIYELNNRAGQARTLGVMIRHARNGKILTEQPIFRVDDWPDMYLTFVDVAAREEKTVTLVTQEGLRTLTGTDTGTLQGYTAAKTIPQRERDVLQAVMDVRSRLNAKQSQLSRNLKQMERLQKGIEMDRTNMASLPRMWGRTRVARKLLASILEKTEETARLETRNDVLSSEIAALESRPDKLLARLSTPQ